MNNNFPLLLQLANQTFYEKCKEDMNNFKRIQLKIYSTMYENRTIFIKSYGGFLLYIIFILIFTSFLKDKPLDFSILLGGLHLFIICSAVLIGGGIVYLKHLLNSKPRREQEPKINEISVELAREVILYPWRDDVANYLVKKSKNSKISISLIRKAIKMQERKKDA